MLYTGSIGFLTYLIIALIIYYFLSRYYLNTNNYSKKEDVDAKLIWYSHRLNTKIILYLLIPLLFYVITQIFFKNKK
jgi:cellulose synthase/poly-beta-1,6-N-acetylglucosamine synthase-like glycosyltransferase